MKNASSSKIRGEVAAAKQQEQQAKPMSLLKLLRLFAAKMQGRPVREMPLSYHLEQGAPISRETITAAASELGLAVSFELSPLAGLSDADFPCLLALQEGKGYLATGWRNERTLYVECGDGPVPIDISRVAETYDGTVLTLTPLPPEEALTGEDEPKAADDNKASLRGGRLTRQIFDHILQHNRSQLVQLAAAAGMSNMLLVVLPLFIMSVYDRIIPHMAIETLWALAFGVMLALLVDLGLRNARSTLLEAIAVSVGNHLQNRYYNRLMRLELAATPRHVGGLTSAMQEFEQLCRIVPQLIISVCIDLPFFLLLMGLLTYMARFVVFAPLIGVTVIAAVNYITFTRSREDLAAAMALGHKRTNQMVETVSAIETLKTTTAEQRLLAQWEALTDEGSYIGYLARHQSGIAGQFAISAVQITIVMTLIIGVYEIQAGVATVGALAASSLLVGRAMAPIGAMIALFVRGSHLMRTASSMEKLEMAPVEKAGDRGRSQAPAFLGRIVMNGVEFGYGDASAPVLRNINLTIEPGERVALVGRIGSGKSSLLKLMPRLYTARSGTLLVDGHDIRQFDPALLRRHMAIMPQEAVLFDATLRENICFGLAQVDERAFEQVVELTGVKDFAAMHPEGYGMRVGPRGERLSGGERASVVLARTLLRDPTLLILDEPTAAMDNELERRVINGLNAWIGERTLILSTHRAPLLALVDRIIWTHQGQIVADGPRDEILQKLKG